MDAETCKIQLASRHVRGGLYARRVELLSLLSPTLRERRVSLLVSPRGSKSAAEHVAGCAGDHEDVYLPFMIVPKALGFDLDASVDEERAVVVSRSIDSVIAAMHLVDLALTSSNGALAQPGEGVVRFLQEICESFPDQEGTACRKVSLRGAQSLFHPTMAREVARLDRAEIRWVATALDSPAWSSELELFARCYVLVYEVRKAREARLLKLRALENAQMSRDNKREEDAFEEYPYPRTTARFFDMSRSASTHLRIAAPEQMFIADAILRSKDGLRMSSVVDQSSTDRLVFYGSNMQSGDSVAEFYLMPETRDFITPAKFISIVSFYAMLTVAVVQFVCAVREHRLLYQLGMHHTWGWLSTGQYDLVDHVSSEAEAALALVMLLPSALLSQLLLLSQDRLRWNSMRGYRIPAVISTLPLIVLSVLTIADFPSYKGYGAAIVWLMAACVTLVCRNGWMRGFEAHISSTYLISRLQSDFRFTSPVPE